MQANFEEVISSFLEKHVGISKEFLSTDLAFQLKSNLIELHKNEAMKLAGIGNDSDLNYDKTIRRDKIFWLDKGNNNKHEHDFFELMDSFVSYLNETCYTAIKSYEFHYALYEKGAFYKKHIDQFKTNSSRAYTMILYLNEGWKEQDGGRLKVYHETEIQLITPNNQKCIFFKSDELAHEVELTHVARSSVTGWLKTTL